jgi:hypothetical protein
MEQRSFAEVGGFRHQEKVTRRERFLEEMQRVMPWNRLEARTMKDNKGKSQPMKTSEDDF